MIKNATRVLGVVLALSSASACGSSSAGSAPTTGGGGAGGSGAGGAAGAGGAGGSAGMVLTGQHCAQTSDCYPGIDPTTLKGASQCLTKAPGGYCTHACQTDADCCAAIGECNPGVVEVCAPFENTGTTMCFVSCASSAIFTPAGWDGGVPTADQFCQEIAGPTFGCRSTGGGKQNKQFCGG